MAKKLSLVVGTARYDLLLDRAADDPYRPDETSEFGFIIPADAGVCANGVERALIHETSLIATGQLQGN